MGRDQKVSLLQGTLDMLILKALAGEPLHGFGVARWIERVTGDRLTVDEGALYPALHRMEKRGWLRSEWRVTENGRRAKYYRVTANGREELSSQVHRWQGSSWAVQRVLETEEG
jgi:transcriptional regulator